MRHGSLFSGIGGFDLAAQWMGWDNVFHCEINEFCQKILKKNFPHVKQYGDIKQFDASPYRGTIDIISGGFPCQPYSSAGKRKGKEDARHLWPEMLRVIREVQPSYVVGENVRGLISWNGGMVFDEVQADLEAEGFTVLPFLLPAAGIDAPHRRDRIWFVAYSHSNDAGRREYGQSGCAPTETKREIWEQRVLGQPERIGEERDFANPQSEGWERRWVQVRNESGQPIITDHCKGNGDAGNITDTDSQLPRHRHNGEAEAIGTTEKEDEGEWPSIPNFEQWPTQPPVCRRDDGVPNRVDRITALGNAVVPQVAYQIFKAIESI